MDISRSEAIEMGLLYEIEKDFCLEAGLTISTAVTKKAWFRAIEITDAELMIGEDETPRLKELLWRAKMGAKQNRFSSTFSFEMAVFRTRETHEFIMFKGQIGTAETGEKTLTISLIKED